MLRFKDAKTDADAVEIRFTSANNRIVRTAEGVHDTYGSPCIVTAGRDGKHKREGKHYKDEAIDFRTWHLNGQPNPCLSLEACSKTCRDILEGMKERLGSDYDVIFEPDLFNETGEQVRWQHIHAEYDPKST